ncbi:chemotaxis protein CheB [Jatrophihabitans fulvus]
MRRTVVTIGASAGGVEALRLLMSGLRADFPGTILVVLHIPPYGGSALPAILDRAGPLPARHPVSGERFVPGTVLVAPPDHHLAVADDHVLLTRGPRENGHRPAVDVLFRSAARALGPRLISVVLSGALDDGTAGTAVVAARGGVTTAQDPGDALYPGMPMNAIEHVGVDHVVKIDELADLLHDLCDEEVADVEPPLSPLPDVEADLALTGGAATNRPERPGRPSGFSCPDCDGVLFEIEDGDLVRYRCRVGHAWSAESLFGEQTTQLDTALWMALRGLEEKAALARTLRERALERGDTLTAQRFAQQDEDAVRAATTIRTLLENRLGMREEGP